MRRQHVANTFQGGFSLALLDEPDDGVDDHDTENDAGIYPVLQNGRNGCCSQQDIDQYIIEMLEKAFQKPVSGWFRQTIGANTIQPTPGLICAQSRVPGLKLRQDAFCVEGMGVFDRDWRIFCHR